MGTPGVKTKRVPSDPFSFQEALVPALTMAQLLAFSSEVITNPLSHEPYYSEGD